MEQVGERKENGKVEGSVQEWTEMRRAKRLMQEVNSLPPKPNEFTKENRRHYYISLRCVSYLLEKISCGAADNQKGLYKIMTHRYMNEMILYCDNTYVEGLYVYFPFLQRLARKKNAS